MKTILALLLLAAAPAHAGKYYSLNQGASSGTLRVGYEGADRSDAVFVSSGAAIIQSTSATATHKFFRLLNNAASEVLSMTQNGVLTAASFVGNVTGNLTGNSAGTHTGAVVGNADTATALASLPTAASSGYVCRGISVLGACLPAWVETAGVSSSTNPVTSGALYTHAALTGTSAHGATTTNTASQLVARDGSGNFAAGTVTAALSGNATTATALAANGANCSAGNYPLGVDASGAVESCTALGAGGDVTQAGPNTFAMSGSLVNVPHRIASATVSGVSTYTFGSDVIGSTRSYELRWNLSKATAGHVYLQFTGDTGTNYSYREADTNSVNTSVQNGNGNSGTYCPLNSTTDVVPDGTGFMGRVRIETLYSFPKRTFVYDGNALVDFTTYLDSIDITACMHRGSAALSSIKITASAGTFTGYLELWESVRN